MCNVSIHSVTHFSFLCYCNKSASVSLTTWESSRSPPRRSGFTNYNSNTRPSIMQTRTLSNHTSALRGELIFSLLSSHTPHRKTNILQSSEKNNHSSSSSLLKTMLVVNKKCQETHRSSEVYLKKFM